MTHVILVLQILALAIVGSAVLYFIIHVLFEWSVRRELRKQKYGITSSNPKNHK